MSSPSSGVSPADPYATAALLRSRRTIHLFASEPPPRELLLEAIDLARWAPNHRLTEPWRFYLLGSETAEAVARLNADLVAEKRGEEAGRKKLERWQSMPGWFVVTSRCAEDPITTQENYAACCCAVQNLMLYLWSEGVGVKWGTGAVTRDPRFFDTQRKPVKEVLEVLP
jgi:nitroreductase